MRGFPTAERVTDSVREPSCSFLPIICRVLRLEGLCMSMPRSKGTRYSLEVIEDKRM